MSWPDAGFDVVPEVFSPVELDSLEKAPSSCHHTRAGARHLMSVCEVADLAQDHRLMGLARAALGPSAWPFRATLFDRSPESNWLVVWHQDTALPLRARRDCLGWGP